MADVLGRVLSDNFQQHFVGRQAEREALLSCLTSSGPLVVYLHGMAGMGKTTLLKRFALDAESQHAVILKLDCRDIEPTERGVLAELAAALELESLTLSEVAEHLVPSGEKVVLVLDDYHQLFLADTWVRQELIPALPSHARVVISSREPPQAGWLSSPELQGLLLTLRLNPLGEEESNELMRRAGLQPAQARAIGRLALGHPLALQLAISSIPRPGGTLTEPDLQAVVQYFAHLHLEQIDDSALRRAVQAASVVRRVTIPLLQVLLPDDDAPSLYDRLRLLPYVEAVREGLMLHGAVQNALTQALRAADPERYRQLREAAWRYLRAQFHATTLQERWRYTIDLLFLLDNEIVRGAFFPASGLGPSNEPARPEDWPAIEQIARLHETPYACSVIQSWWQLRRNTFEVVKDASGQVEGFFIIVDGSRQEFAQLASTDPITAAWQRHLREHPVAPGETVVFLRRWLSRDHGELPSTVQSASWLNVKRHYMALRPQLRRCYMSLSGLETYAAVAASLGFSVVEGASVDLDGARHHLVVLDLGPRSVDGWLSAHVARELGLDDAGLLDLRSHELVLEGRRIHLTPLEFEVMRYMLDRRGEAVSRADLLESVWGYAFNGDSNVVETLVAGLRRKLQSDAGLIETVWGVGYRLRDDPTWFT